jgi:hypothetical protein
LVNTRKHRTVIKYRHTQTKASFYKNIVLCFSASILSLEKPVEMAMLTSLTGIKCMITNQWHCTLAENAIKLKLTMKGK